jgi:hypothetical protein
VELAVVMIARTSRQMAWTNDRRTSDSVDETVSSMKPVDLPYHSWSLDVRFHRFARQRSMDRTGFCRGYLIMEKERTGHKVRRRTGRRFEPMEICCL